MSYISCPVNPPGIFLLPLRERKEDLAHLIDHFCQKHSKRLNIHFTISGRALEILKAYHWPGNVRELENVIERCALLTYSRSSRCIEEQDVMSYSGIKKVFDSNGDPGGKVVTAGLVDNLEALERQAIVEVLKQTDGNVTRAASKLGPATL